MALDVTASVGLFAKLVIRNIGLRLTLHASAPVIEPGKVPEPVAG